MLINQRLEPHQCESDVDRRVKVLQIDALIVEAFSINFVLKSVFLIGYIFTILLH